MEMKIKYILAAISFLLLTSCNTQNKEKSVYGSWEFIRQSDKILLVFNNDTLTQHYYRPDTAYKIQCTYKIIKDTLLLTFFDNSYEVHYLKWLSNNKFILNPQEPNKQSIPAIDLIEFRKVN